MSADLEPGYAPNCYTFRRLETENVKTKQEIFERLRSILVELFEVAPDRVTLESHLYQDLEIDSIDTIDLILELKDITGRKIQPEQFRHVRTVGDAVDAIYALMLEPTNAVCA